MEKKEKKVVGLIVNPIAGIGGKVGLKGSDGEGTVEKAFSLGAERVAPDRATDMLRKLKETGIHFELVTYPELMGALEAQKCGLSPIVLGSISPGETTALDTRNAANDLRDYGVDLLLFVGGDGTARDVYQAIGHDVPALGIPAGVKIHSSVYAINPRRAAELVKAFFQERASIREQEVMDIDEEEFREGRVSAQLFGYLRVPFEPRLIQGAKASSRGTGESKRAIAEDIADRMNGNWYYILGPGTTVAAIGDELGIEKSLLGVDVVHDKKLIGKDVNESELLEIIDGQKSKIIVTVIGGQGYIFGRGNQQISPRVIRMVGTENVIVVASKSKINELNGPLLVDTGDTELDEELGGYIRVVTGYQEESLIQVGV